MLKNLLNAYKGANIPFYYTMNFMQGQGLVKSRSHAHV